MTAKSTSTRFHTLVHRSISDSLWRAIQADALASEIASRRSWINNMGHGPLFATLQLVLADEMILAVTRMFDKPDKNYPTQSIPAVLRFMDSGANWLPIRNRAPLEGVLLSTGLRRPHLRALDDAALTRRLAAHYLGCLPNPDNWKTHSLSASLRALRFRRNKQVAHTQAVSTRKRLRPAWDDARSLLRWTLEFADVIGSAYLDYYFLASDRRTFLRDRSARQAALDLGHVLDKAGLRRGRFRRGAA